MKVLIRADASSTMGAGHVMRCLTLAAALRGHGVEVVFACCELPGNLIDTVCARGYEVIKLSRQYAMDWSAELIELQSMLEETFDWIIVDHYQLGWDWEHAIRPYARRIMVIDDLCNRPHDADLLLDQNLSAEAETYRQYLPKACQLLLLGPRFALLRPEFSVAALVIQAELKRIVVNFGAADPTRELFKVMDALQDLQQFEVDFIAGLSNPAWLELQQRALSQPCWSLHRHIENIADFIRQADLCIGAAGSSSWERAAMGLPTLCISIAPNQKAPAKAMHTGGMHIYLGESDEVSVKHIQQQLIALTFSQRQSLAFTSMGAVDGRGVERVVAALMQTDMQIRLATYADAQLLFDARNAPEVRCYSTQSAPLEWNEHCVWLENKLVDPSSMLLIGSAVDGAVGVVRFDRCNDQQVKISIYLLAQRLGLGWGRFLLQSAEHYLVAHWLDIKLVSALVKDTNLSSIQLFRDNGYQFDGIYYIHSLNERRIKKECE